MERKSRQVIVSNNGFRKNHALLYGALGIGMIGMGIVTIKVIIGSPAILLGSISILIGLFSLWLLFLELYSRNDFVKFELSGVEIRSTPTLGTGLLPTHLQIEYPNIKAVNVAIIQDRLGSSDQRLALIIDYAKNTGETKRKILLDRFPPKTVLNTGQIIETSARIGSTVKQFMDTHPEFVNVARKFLKGATKLLDSLKASQGHPTEAKDEPLDDTEPTN